MLVLAPGPDAASDDSNAATSWLEEIVVVANKVARPLWRVSSQVTTLYRDDLRYQQVRSFGEITRYEPAIEAEDRGTRFGDSGVSIRGIGGNRVTMELDGVPLPGGFSVGEFANSARSALDPAIIERVEMLRGPASALYGSDALGGVVAITSIQPADLLGTRERLYLGGGAGYDSADSGNLGYATLATSLADQDLLVSFSHRVGNEVDAARYSGPKDRIDYETSQSFAKWVAGIGRHSSLQLVVDHHSREVDSDLQTVLGFGRQFRNSVDLKGQDKQERTRVSLGYEIRPEHLLDFASLMVFRQATSTDQHTRDLRADGAGALDLLVSRRFLFEETTWGGETRLRRDFDALGGRHLLVAGMEFERQAIRELRDGLLTDLRTGTTSNVLPPGETLPTRDLPESRADQFGIYLQDEITWDHITLIPALRWDRFELDALLDQLIIDPTRVSDLASERVTVRLGAVGRLGQGSTWYAHYAEGFRAPPAEEVNLYLDYRGAVTVRALPNPDLVPEASTHLELGVRHESNGLSLELGGYQSSYNNFIESRVMIGVDPTDGALLFQSRNIEAATIYGVEARLRQQLGEFFQPWHALSAELALHWSRGENDTTGMPLNVIAPPKFVAGLHWQEFAPFSASLMIRFLEQQSRTDFSTSTFFVPPSATVVDLLARWQPTSWLSINAGVYNLTDSHYWRYGDVQYLDASDPRVASLAKPGRNFGLTLHVGTP